MGLAGRKEKQRIGADPRNLTWAHDNSRFGQQYLAKFGWTPESGSGLGANGDGRTSHVAVALKLNQLGIGNGPSSNGAGDPNAIAWKQNRDFENVLKKLNGTALNPLEGGMENVKIEKALFNGFVRPENAKDHTLGGKEEPEEEEEKVEDEKTEKQKQKEERRRKRESKALASQSGTNSIPVEEAAVAPTSIPSTTRPKAAPHLAHRAKFRASKQLASLSSAALSEILGVSRSATSTPVIASVSATSSFPSQVQSTLHTPQNEPVDQVVNPPPVIDDQLTTSSTSVADYFAAKLKARRAQITTVAVETTITGLETTGGETNDKKRAKKRKRENKAVENEEVDVTTITTVDSSSERKEKKKRKKEEDGGEEPKSSKSKKKKRLKE